MLKALLTPARGVAVDQPLDALKATLDKLFVFSFIWGLGGNTLQAGMEQWDTFVRELFNGLVIIPGLGQVYDYFVEPKVGYSLGG